MKALKYGFGLILVGGFALTASCGGSSSDDSSSASAGSSSTTDTGGTTGTTSGGAGTVGGTTGTTSGGAGTTTGGAGTTTGGAGTTTGGAGTTTGGAGTTTGGAGTTTGGAGATNPAGCPAATTTPKTGDACTANAMGRTTCTYAAADPGEETMCGCAAANPGRGRGGGAAGAADVMDTLTCATACAAHTSTPPMTGETCSLTGIAAAVPCTFGPDARTNTDRCTCRMGKWACTAIGGMGAAGAAN